MNRKTWKGLACVAVAGAGATFFTGEARGACVQAEPAATCVCDEAVSDITICVRWDAPAPPEPPFDFAVDFTCPGCATAPNIVLINGNDEWSVWSRTPPDVPADIGNLTIDPSPGADSFGVKIAHGVQDGAVNVGSIVLDDPDPAWTGHSSTTSSRISGDLTGALLVVEDEQGNGGTVFFGILGSALGPITIPTVLGLQMNGDASGDIEIGTLRNVLSIGGDLYANIDITEEMRGGSFTVSGAVYEGADIHIAALVTNVTIEPVLLFNTRPKTSVL